MLIISNKVKEIIFHSFLRIKRFIQTTDVLLKIYFSSLFFILLKCYNLSLIKLIYCILYTIKFLKLTIALFNSFISYNQFDINIVYFFLFFNLKSNYKLMVHYFEKICSPIP